MALLSAMKDSSEDLIIGIDFPLVKSVDMAFLNTVLTIDDFRSYDFVEEMEAVKQFFPN
jgi:hypothetical protein